MSEEMLPVFRYYRDPVGDETIVSSASACTACGRVRGFIVTSTFYGAEVPRDAQFCPWCIADGSAHRLFGAFFNEVDLGAAPEPTAEVQNRTPGFATWQDLEWPTHCEDVGVYLGQPTGAELRSNQPAYEALLSDVAEYEWGRDPQYMRDFVDGLGGSQVVYLFECPRCAAQLVRWDLD